MKNSKKIIYSIFILFLTGCAVFPPTSEEYINNTTSFDESEISISENDTCSYENLIREKFPNYRVHKQSENEIWFFDFKEVINSTGAGKFYLMEVFSVNYDDPAKTTCSVKYFSSFEKRLNKIKSTDKSGNGINNLIQILKDCNNGR